MKRTIMYRLANVSMIAAIGVFGLTACNSDDYKTSDSSATSGTSATSPTVSASPDSSSSGQASTATANAADGNVAGDNGTKTGTTAASAGAGKRLAKKGKASVSWAPDNSVKMEKDKDGVYNRTDVMPEFPGGETGLSRYVNDHLEYPQQAIDDNTTGTVKVSFVIDEHGKVSGARLMNGTRVGNGLDEQALRVVNTMPAWKPGKVHGKNVKTRLELPISFQLEA